MRLPFDVMVRKPLTDPPWVVRGILPRQSFAILAGEPSAGKTTLAQHLSMCAAGGHAFLGTYAVEPTRVLYIDEENGLLDVERYWQSMWRGLGCPDPDAIAASLRIEHFSISAAWDRDLTALAKDYQPGLIVIDTATPTMQIIDENDNAEASRKIQLLRRVQRAANNDTTLLVLKHEKTRDDKTHRRTVRGAKTWIGQVDIVMYLSFGRGGSGKMKKTYLRADKPRAFGLDHVVQITPSVLETALGPGLNLNAHALSEEPDDAK